MKKFIFITALIVLNSCSKKQEREFKFKEDEKIAITKKELLKMKVGRFE